MALVKFIFKGFSATVVEVNQHVYLSPYVRDMGQPTNSAFRSLFLGVTKYASPGLHTSSYTTKLVKSVKDTPPPFATTKP